MAEVDWLEYRNGKLYWTRRASSKAPAGSEAGWFDKDGYICVTVARVKRKVSRLIWEMHFGPIPDGLLVDHINGVVSDNRVENLRLVTPSQNATNRQVVANAKGYTFTKGAYQVMISSNGTHKYVGRFKTQTEAKEAYEKEAIAIHGEYRRQS